MNIDHQAPVRAFGKLGIPDFDFYYSKVTQSSLFVDLETGAISPDVFRDRLRENLPVPLTDKQINQAWATILLGFPEERIRLLERLRTDYRIFLLSNTNIMHFETFNHTLKTNYGYAEMGEMMERAYYSHQLGLRKPSPEIFRHVIEDAGLNPKRTLFIDDTEEHILAAQKLGLSVHHLKDGENIEDLFKNEA